MLVTGCSSGIGHATALALARAGFPVWASARKEGCLGELEAAGCRVLELDVTDEQSRVAAVRQVEAEHGAVGVLVNNAGHGGGPVEEVPLEIVREAFETNVFAAIHLCQLVLPGIRAQRSGLIVNLGSAVGMITPPTGCPYAMTKYAMESLCDALRPEVAPFGIEVTLIQPGAVRTRFMANSELHQPAGDADSPYAVYKANVAKAATAQTYVRFADEHRPLFQALAGSGLDKDRHPEIARAAQPIAAAFLALAAELADGDQATAARLVSAVVATAHGHAMLMLDGTFGSGRQAADTAAGQAAAATLALITGREALSARI